MDFLASTCLGSDRVITTCISVNIHFNVMVIG